jgi:GTP1/Obg family GTP-binding protein
MNDVERVSVLVVKYVAEKLIYVFDLTESAYPLKDQITLYNELKKYKKPMIVYLSKTDILDKEKVKAFSLKGETIITEKKELQTVLEG